MEGLIVVAGRKKVRNARFHGVNRDLVQGGCGSRLAACGLFHFPPFVEPAFCPPILAVGRAFLFWAPPDAVAPARALLVSDTEVGMCNNSL
jgi:hypothetical protein